MAKEFSAADVFNNPIEDEYKAEPIVVNDSAEVEKIDNKENLTVNEQEDYAFLFDEADDEEVIKEKKKISVDFKQLISKLSKIKKPDFSFIKGLIKAEEVTEKTERIPVGKKKFIFMTVMVLLTVLIFAMFGNFMYRQYSLIIPSHDDYGYATLSYVYWEEGMWGQDFSMDQLVHYLTQHYNKWGGRILSFGQSILLLREGLDVAQGFHAVTLFLTFLLAFLFAQNGKKTKLLPLSAIFTCAMFGMIGKDISISGFYWYCAAILYTVPVLYVFIGAWLLYIMMLDKREKTISVSKLMILPFATVLFFYAGWSMEQVGIFAVVVSAAMLIYACFKRRNPFVLVYGVPPFLSSVIGCHILINAIGNNSRQRSHADYYNLPFSEQILTSGDTIAKTLFRAGNILTVILIALLAISAAIFILRKKRNIFTYSLLGLNAVLAAYSLAVSANNIQSTQVSTCLWIYLVVMAATVSIWLFSSKRKQDYLIWALFFGSLASQGACLIAPIFPDRCLMMFVLTLAVVGTRAFNEYLSIFETFDKKKALASALSVTFAFSMMGTMGASQVYNGFVSNDRVQQYNTKMLEITGKLYDEFDISCAEIPLMKLQDETYTGSTMPYGRDLIKDWMKIYYKLPDNLQYDDFAYEEYNENRLSELEGLLKEKENKYNELKNNA